MNINKAGVSKMNTSLVDSRCGLHCTSCAWKESHGCGGCIETMGNPFHGECPIAICCQSKGLTHCGECDVIPCDKLYEYSYLDPEHGDKPQGLRVDACRRWAGESGHRVWDNVLLTSAGWFTDIDGGVKTNIRDRFLKMVHEAAGDAKSAKVLFVPTADIDCESRLMVGKCMDELLDTGILKENIFTYDIDGSMSEAEVMKYDVIYFTGGSTGHLLKRIKDTGFDSIVKKMVYANKVYVGASAGSIIATPNIGGAFDEKTAGLSLVNAYISVHMPANGMGRTDLPLPHIPLTDNQALAVSWAGYEIIEG